MIAFAKKAGGALAVRPERPDQTQIIESFILNVLLELLKVALHLPVLHLFL